MDRDPAIERVLEQIEAAGYDKACILAEKDGRVVLLGSGYYFQAEFFLMLARYCRGIADKLEGKLEE